MNKQKCIVHVLRFDPNETHVLPWQFIYNCILQIYISANWFAFKYFLPPVYSCGGIGFIKAFCKDYTYKCWRNYCYSDNFVINCILGDVWRPIYLKNCRVYLCSYYHRAHHHLKSFLMNFLHFFIPPINTY